MFRRDPVKLVLAQVSGVLRCDQARLLPLMRAVFRRGGVLGVARGQTRLILPLGGVPVGGAFELASVSKPFTAALADALVRQGALDWDGPLARLGGPIRVLPGSLTARRLATHTAGLPLHPARVAVTTFTHFHDPYVGMTARDVLSSARRWARPTRPERFTYSNLGVGVLALSLAHAADEEVSAAGFERALRRQVTGSLGLNVALGANLTELVSPTGLLGGREFTQFGVLAGAGGLYGTADDLLSFAQAHLSGQAGTHWRQTTRPAGLPPHLSAVAPGWFVTGNTNWHDGVARGTRTALGFNAQTQTAVVLLARGAVPLIGLRGSVPMLLLELLGSPAA